MSNKVVSLNKKAIRYIITFKETEEGVIYPEFKHIVLSGFLIKLLKTLYDKYGIGFTIDHNTFSLRYYDPIKDEYVETYLKYELNSEDLEIEIKIDNIDPKIYDTFRNMLINMVNDFGLKLTQIEEEVEEKYLEK